MVGEEGRGALKWRIEEATASDEILEEFDDLFGWAGRDVVHGIGERYLEHDREAKMITRHG